MTQTYPPRPTSRPEDSASGLLTVMLEMLTAAQTSFVVLRNYEELPERWGNDVDIMAAPRDLPQVQQLLRQAIRQSPYAADAQELTRLNFWSCRIPCSDRELQVDVYTAMSKAWVTYAEAGPVLHSRRQEHCLFAVPDPCHERLLIAAKELFAYGSIRPRYHTRLTGRDPEERAYRAAQDLFAEHLSANSCIRIAGSLQDPQAPARLLPRSWRLLDAGAAIRWARQRRNSWQQMRCLGPE